jgi:hypothetical protein
VYFFFGVGGVGGFGTIGIVQLVPFLYKAQELLAFEIGVDTAQFEPFDFKIEQF